MTTATGQIEIDFKVLGDQNPFSNAEYSQIGGSGCILSNRFGSAAINTSAQRYGGSISETENIVAKIEVDSVGNFNVAAAIVVNSNGDGYAAIVNGFSGTTISLVRLLALAAVDYLATGSPAVSAGDVVSLSRVQATGAMVVYVNGTASGITATDTTVMTGIAPGWMTAPDNPTGAWIGSFAADGVVLGPTIVSVDDSTPADGGTLVITCTNAGAVEGSVTIDGVAQQVDAWADTEITITLSDIRCFYSANVDLIIIDSDDNASSAEVIQVTPPSGWDVVTFGTLASAANRVVWSPDLETGWQGAWGDVVGGTVNDMAWLDDGSLAYSEALTSCMLKVNDGTQWLAAEPFYFVGSGRGLALDLSRDLSRDLSLDLSA